MVDNDRTTQTQDREPSWMRERAADQVLPKWRFDVEVPDVAAADTAKAMLDEITAGGTREIPEEHKAKLEQAIAAAALLGRRHPQGSGTFRLEEAQDGRVQVQVLHDRLRSATATVVVGNVAAVPNAPLAPQPAAVKGPPAATPAATTLQQPMMRPGGPPSAAPVIGAPKRTTPLVMATTGPKDVTKKG